MPRLTRRIVILTILFASACLACLGQAPSLANVRKVYVEPMENHLDQYLTSEISRQFHGSLQIVTSAAEADAVLKGVNLGAQSTNKATVNLVDPNGQNCVVVRHSRRPRGQIPRCKARRSTGRRQPPDS